MEQTRRQGDAETRRAEETASARVSPGLLVSLSPGLAIALIAYALLLGVVAWSLFWARNWALTEMAKPRSLEQWQEWREDVRAQQTAGGPVRLRVPKSSEPPALVLMRDYFPVSLGGAIVFSSVLYWVIAWFVSGILRNSAVGAPSPLTGG